MGESLRTIHNASHYASLDNPTASAEQVAFYDLAAQWVQDQHQTVVEEEDETVASVFPYQWTSLGIFAHDLTTVHELRCAWYEEYLYWGGSSATLSLAYLMARWRIEGRVGPAVESGWLPMEKNEPRILDDDDQQLFMRVLKRRASR